MSDPRLKTGFSKTVRSAASALLAAGVLACGPAAFPLTAKDKAPSSSGTARRHRRIVKRTDDDSYLIVEKNETVSGAFDKNLSLDALTRKITRNKLKANADVIARLKTARRNNRTKIKRLREIIKASKSNPERFAKLLGRKRGRFTKSGTSHVAGTAQVKLRGTKRLGGRLDAELAGARRETETIRAREKRYGKVQAKLGVVGKVLSVYDAAQSAYYTDKRGKVRFSRSKFLTNAAMNLSGAAGFVSAYKAGAHAKEKEFMKALDEYQKAGLDITDPAVVNRALLRATGKGLLVGAYNGAKCVPLAGDMIAVGELTEASVGLVYDTMQSNRIQAENAEARKRQGERAVAMLRSRFADYKECESKFKELTRYSDEITREFPSLRNQYVQLLNNEVERERKAPDLDALRKTAAAAEPYLEPARLDKLRGDAERLVRAIETTAKLAEVTVAGRSEADPAAAKRTADELERMTRTLSAIKEECAAASKAMAPLLNGGASLESAAGLAEEAAAERTVADDLRKSAIESLKAHARLLKLAEQLRLKQEEILDSAKSSLAYFHANGDDDLKSRLEIEFRTVLQYKIDDYGIKRMRERQNSISFSLRDFRAMTELPGDLPPELAAEIAKAAEAAPRWKALNDIINSGIITAEKSLAQIRRVIPRAPGKRRSECDVTVALGGAYGEKDFIKMSLQDIIEAVAPDPKKGNRDLCGFKYYKSGAAGHCTGNEFVPEYNNTRRKLLEKGKVRIWRDRNSNNRKDVGETKSEPYWVWLEIPSSNPIQEATWWMWRDKKNAAKRYSNCVKRLAGYHRFTTNSIAYGIIGPSKYDKSKLRGFAFHPPFIASVEMALVCQIGSTTAYLGKTDDISDAHVRKVFLGKLNPWKSEVERQVEFLLDKVMELPVRYAKFADKHFYRSVATVKPKFKPQGFALVNSREDFCSFVETFSKEWVLENAYRETKASETYRVEIHLNVPNRRESWRTFLAKQRKTTIARGSVSKKSNMEMWETGLPADAIAANKFVHKTFYNANTKSARTVYRQTVYGLNEYIYIQKGNVRICVSGSGRNRLQPRLQTLAFARKVLTKFNKPSIK